MNKKKIIKNDEIIFSLGSNTGDRIAYLRTAVRKLSQRVKIHKVSSLYSTAPVDYTDQPFFLNLCAAGTSALDPMTILLLAKDIEKSLGRNQDGVSGMVVPPKGPRTIDIDIIMYGMRLVDTEELQIPHPAWSRRKFVLLPLKEILPGFTDPFSRKNIDFFLKDLSVKNQDVSKCSEGISFLCEFDDEKR